MAKDEPAEDDYSFMILKNRLAKGEITIEEFDTLKKKLMENDPVDNLKRDLKNLNEKMEGMKNEQSVKIRDLIVSSYKSEGTALVLSLLLGFIGILGVGHMYVGKTGKGVGILITGLFFILVTGSFVYAWDSIVNCHYCGIPLGQGFTVQGLLIADVIAYLVLWIWQIRDARKLCQEYNENLSNPRIQLENNAEIAYHTSNLQEALNIYDQLFYDYPSDTEIKKNRAKTQAAIAYESAEYENALNIYNKLVDDHPADIIFLKAKARTLEKLERFNEAKDVYELILQQLPENKEIKKRLAEVNKKVSGKN